LTLDAAHPDLERQANVIADWAENLPLKRVYIFGSRVRGDAAPDSDIDVAIEFEFQADSEAMRNWIYQNDSGFAELKTALGVPLSLHHDCRDSAWPVIRAGAVKPVFSVGKVLCVITPRRHD
jgi:predicted nucleotidyltransferase